MTNELEAFTERITDYAQAVADSKFIAPEEIYNLRQLLDKIRQAIVSANIRKTEKESILSSLNVGELELENSNQRADFSYLVYDLARKLRAFVRQICISAQFDSTLDHKAVP
jgi:hypothetical protein